MKPDKTVSKNYFGNLLSARPLFTVSLPSLDSLAHFLYHTAILNPFKYSNMQNWSSNISSEHFFYGCECFRSRPKHKLNIKSKIFLMRSKIFLPGFRLAAL